MAMEMKRLVHWWRVLSRELISGVSLGLILGSVGLMRIMLWPSRATLYGPHYMSVGIAVAFSLVGVVLWGSVIGSMLPFILRFLKFDPASATGIPTGGIMVHPAGKVHYDGGRDGEVVVQMMGIGPSGKTTAVAGSPGFIKVTK